MSASRISGWLALEGEAQVRETHIQSAKLVNIINEGLFSSLPKDRLLVLEICVA